MESSSVSGRFDKNGKHVYFWKRKRVTEKVYYQRLSQIKSGQKRRKYFNVQENEVSSCNLEDVSPNLQDGSLDLQLVSARCIVEINTLKNNLICKSCQEVLSLADIIEETLVGLASIFQIQCRKCLNINNVQATKQYVPNNTCKGCCNINTEAALGPVEQEKIIVKHEKVTDQQEQIPLKQDEVAVKQEPIAVMQEQIEVKQELIEIKQERAPDIVSELLQL